MDGRARNLASGGGDARAPAGRPSTAGARGPSSSTGSSGQASGMSRAERFDDERRRITESCFARVDDQGQLQESYITHIRVQEDGSHPQSPPPPSSPASNKKARIIIVSVRNTGRVKLHKARENANGTFSIGKTWPMEELSAVDNFVHSVPANDDEALRKQWAGDRGFTVTISKPYYWEAGTPKEKEFFIGSIVKIYNKYTKGDFPALTGFTAAELNSLTNGQANLATSSLPRQGTPDQVRQPPPKSPNPPIRPGQSHEDMRKGQSPVMNPNFRRNPGEYQGARRPGQPDDQFRNGSRPGTGDDSRRPPPLNQNQNAPPMPDLRQQPSVDQGLRMRPSGESMRMRAAQGREPMPPTPSFPPQNLTPKSSTPELVGRPKTPDSSVLPVPPTLSPGRRPPGQDAPLQRPQRSAEDLSFNGAGAALPPQDRRQNGYPSPRRDPSSTSLRPETSQSNASSTYLKNEEGPPEEPPQRRRPFMDSKPSQVSERSVDSQSTVFHTPATSPTPQVEVPPRRRPQDLAERVKSPPQEIPEPPKSALSSPQPPQPPPPNSPLPSLPLTPASQPSQADETASLTKTTSIESESTQSVVSPTTEETHRPGLGPMIKKNMGASNAASKFRKAAVAAGAFKPRAGGAAAKLFNKETKTDEADGVNAVFVPQRPTPKATPKEEVEKKLEEAPKAAPDRSSKDKPVLGAETVPAVTISSPLSPVPDSAGLKPEDQALPPTPNTATTNRKVEADREARRKKRRSNQQVQNISRLGIDPTIIDERGLEFEGLLSELGWGSRDLSAKSIETLEGEVKREIARVEAGSWLNHLEQKDDRVDAVERMLDRAIAECDELEGLLTLYNVELSSLNDDIAFIEAQSQGLQVQTANQRLLQHELQQLVETISITTDQLEPLRRSPIGKTNGLRDIETSLVLLYKALITIDPSFVAGNRSNDAEPMDRRSGLDNSHLGRMQALQEKRDRYLSEGANFLDRLQKHMEITFGAAFLSTKDALATIDQGSLPSLKKNIEAHDAGRSELWMLSPIMLFAKEIDRNAWDLLMRMYQRQAAQLYQQEVRDNILAWKRFARKPTGEEQELLFTAQEKETESIAGTARKLTVKRSQTLARGLRAASGDKESKASKPSQDGKLYAYDVFARVLDDTGPVLLTEQNFVTEFFHATSTDSIDFPEAVQAAAPEARRGPNLWIRKQFEADRTMAKLVTGVMEEIFNFWPTEIQSLVEWAMQADPLQGVGILGAVDKKLLDIEDSNQDFLTRNLQKIHERLQGLFTRFLDEQIRAIEDTKVKIKKRKGVIAFMKTFPHFSVAIENMLPPASEGGEHLEIRRMVNEGYQRINKAMFESLKVIAKESPAVMASQGQGDPEDKEALNYHILLIENMNHYMEEVDAQQPDSVLEFWKTKAQDEYNEHMELYVDAVIRRPLGKLLEFIESTETLLGQAGASPQSLAQRSSHSRSTFKKLAHSNDGKEMRKGIEALKKRVDKHFGDADDPTISKDLVFKVLKECEKKYVSVSERMATINQDVYGGEIEVDWGANEVNAAFRR